MLVFPGPAGEQRDATLCVLAEWLGRMPLVEFVLAAEDVDSERSELASYGDRVLGDPGGTTQGVFGLSDTGGAVLLGTDALLAGGPVVGAAAMTDLLEAMAAGFTDAFGEAMRPLTPISCKCITYGRVEHLEESLESFLRQDYAGDHELVIVNDYPRQRLHFDHPRVRIINLDFTFETIGEKENFAVSACRYDTVAVWDDDDIALPHHLRNIDRYYPGHDLLHWQRGVAFVDGTIEALTSLGNSGIVYSKPRWREAGGHPFENAGYDVTFVNRLRAPRCPARPRDATTGGGQLVLPVEAWRLPHERDGDRLRGPTQRRAAPLSPHRGAPTGGRDPHRGHRAEAPLEARLRCSAGRVRPGERPTWVSERLRRGGE